MNQRYPSSRSRVAAAAIAAAAIMIPFTRLVADAAVVTVTAVAREAMPSPDGNGSFGTYTSYGEPCLNDSGQVAFTCRLASTLGGTTDDDVLCRVSRDGTRVFIAREGQPIPGGPGAFGAIHNPVLRQYAMNDSGRVAFVTPLTGTVGGTTDNAALYTAREPGLFWQHARRGQSVPGTTSLMNGIFPPQINNQPPAAVSFYASLGTSSSPGVLYTHRLGVLTAVSWVDSLAPDFTKGTGLNGTLFSYPFAGSDPAALRPNATEVAFYAHAAATAMAPIDDDGVFAASPDGIADAARGAQSAPGGGTYQEFSSSPVLNADGVMAFGSNLRPVPSAGEVIALDWAFGTGDLVAYTGQTAADGNGVFSSLYAPSLNINEAVSYRVALSGTSGGGFDDSAIYKGDSSLLIVPALEDQLAREDQLVPDGNGRFASFGAVTAISDVNQVLFTAALRGTSGGASDDRALMLWDPEIGLVTMLREGDVIDGRHVATFSTLIERDMGGYRVFNDMGEAVARLDFVEPGGDGIYRFQLVRSTTGVTHSRVATTSLSLAVGPNPVRGGAVSVTWGADRAIAGRVTVLDAGGRHIRTLAERTAAAASGSLRWDLLDDGGRPVAAGIYVVLLETPAGSRARRVACVR